MNWVYLSNKSASLKDDSTQMSLKSGNVDYSIPDDNCIFYPALFWKRKVQYNSDKQSYSVLFWMIFIFVLCPMVWFSLTVIINAVESELWDFSYTSLLWIVYFIATFSVVLDCAVNLCIVKNIAGNAILNNVMGDFVFITLSLAGFLLPLMVKDSVEPDDQHNTTYTQMSVNLLDKFALLSLTASNIIFNNLIGAVISQTIVHQQVYLKDILKQADSRHGQISQIVHAAIHDGVGAAHALIQTKLDSFKSVVDSSLDGVADAAKNLASKHVTIKGVEREVEKVVDKGTVAAHGAVDKFSDDVKKSVDTEVDKAGDKAREQVHRAVEEVPALNRAASGLREHKQELLKITRVVDRMVDEIDLSTSTGRFRFYLRLKMLLNIASSTLFLFYTNIYLSVGKGAMIFVLIITVLSFLNNMTSSMVIRLHDKAVRDTYSNEAFRMKLELGEYGGFDHVQFYYTVVVGLLNIILRATSINYSLP